LAIYSYKFYIREVGLNMYFRDATSDFYKRRLKTYRWILLYDE